LQLAVIKHEPACSVNAHLIASFKLTVSKKSPLSSISQI